MAKWRRQQTPPSTEQTSFRKWLVLRVESTRFATIPMADDAALERHAEQLGVTPEVLLEARVNRKLKLAANGIPQAGRSRDPNWCRLMLDFAQEPWDAWRAHVENWGVPGPALLRSMLHLYLENTYEPPDVTGRWMWQGRQLPVVRGGKCREKFQVSRGARLALDLRAAARGCSIMGIMRALVVENMAGKFAPRGLLRIVDVSSMHADVDRYYVG